MLSLPFNARIYKIEKSTRNINPMPLNFNSVISQFLVTVSTHSYDDICFNFIPVKGAVAHEKNRTKFG